MKFGMRIRLWIKALRAPFFTATGMSVILGVTFAWYHTGKINWLYFFLTLFGVVFMNAGTNLINDYFDYKTGNDNINKNPTEVSGGSRVIQQGLIKPKYIFFAGIIFFVLAAIIGLYINFTIKGNIVLLLGTIGIISGFFYVAPPLKFGYTFLSEIITGINCGMLIVFGSYYVQTQMVNFNVILISVPLTLLVSLILFINEFPDYEADKSVGRRNLVILLKKKKAIKVFVFSLVSVYIIILGLVVFDYIPVFGLLSFLTLFFLYKVIKITLNNYNRVYELVPANKMVINIHLLTGILLSFSFILDKVL